MFIFANLGNRGNLVKYVYVMIERSNGLHSSKANQKK